jgi:integrase
MKGGFKTKAEAAESMARSMTDAQSGLYAEPGKGRVTVEAWLTEWLRTAAGRRQPNTMALYEHAVRAWIIPKIGGLELRQVTPRVLQQLYNELALKGGRGGKPLSASSVRQVHVILHQALGRAARWRVGLASNPATDGELELPRVRREPVRTWSPDDAKLFLKSVKGDRLEALWVVLLATGMRRGEALGLRWEHVNLRRGTVSIAQTVVAVNGRPVVSEPKTASSWRVVSLRAGSIRALREHRARQSAERGLAGERWQDSGLVFTTELGGVLDPNNVARAFDLRVDRAGVPRITLHGLRHTAATLALAANVHPKKVQEMLGHGDIGMTLDLYSHVTDAMHGEATDAIELQLFDPDV